MLVKQFALIAGIVYLAVGILGFFPPLLTTPATAPHLVAEAFHGQLFGLFPVNWLHNLVHLAIGVWGLAAARDFRGAVSFSRGLTVIYAILAVMGLFPVLNTTFGLIPLHGHDIWLHAGTAAVAAYFGWGAPARVRREAKV